MIRVGCFALMSGLLLGTANPPPRPRLDYQFAGLIRSERGCAHADPARCAILTFDPIKAAAAEKAEAARKALRALVGPPARGADSVRVLVSIPQQKAWVFKGRALVATAPVSTGKPGHPTPTGTFPILMKRVHHRSSKYSNAPMPYMQKLTHYGIALHAGRLPGYPASHGCIRLPWGFAKSLYNMTDERTRVTITRSRPRSSDEASRLI